MDPKASTEKRSSVVRSNVVAKVVTACLLAVNACWIALQSEKTFWPYLPMEDFELPIRSQSRIAANVASTAVEFNHTLKPRYVSFLRPKDWKIPQKEAYSGMWWLATERFLETKWSGMISLETASFRAFGNNRARKTRDWLDLGVTHLSKYWKHFSRGKGEADTEAFASIEKVLDDYLTNTQPLPILPGSAAPDTLALIPFLAPKPDAPDHVLSEKALEATIASVWQIGISRCVVVVRGGKSPVAEEILVRRIFQSLLERQTKSQRRPMAMEVVVVPNVTAEERKNMPQVALIRLKQAMEGTLSPGETQRWFGEERDDVFKFVYFSEPDLILHVRPSAMPALTAQMIKGSTLSGHRFQPIPHQVNFPDYTRLYNVVPNNFAQLPEPMDPLSEEQSCCDGGQYYPSNLLEDPTEHLSNNKACVGRGAYWWQCGFWYRKKDYTQADVSRELHHFLVNYTLFRIHGGTDFPLIDHHQRICSFHNDSGQNCAEGHPPDDELDKKPGSMRAGRLFQKKLKEMGEERDTSLQNKFHKVKDEQISHKKKVPTMKNQFQAAREKQTGLGGR